MYFEWREHEKEKEVLKQDHRALSGGTSTPPLGDDDAKESATRTPDQVEKSIEQASAQLSYNPIWCKKEFGQASFS